MGLESWIFIFQPANKDSGEPIASGVALVSMACAVPSMARVLVKMDTRVTIVTSVSAARIRAPFTKII